jgi:hypothetical protein
MGQAVGANSERFETGRTREALPVLNLVNKGIDAIPTNNWMGRSFKRLAINSGIPVLVNLTSAAISLVATGVTGLFRSFGEGPYRANFAAASYLRDSANLTAKRLRQMVDTIPAKILTVGLVVLIVL